VEFVRNIHVKVYEFSLMQFGIKFNLL